MKHSNITELLYILFILCLLLLMCSNWLNILNVLHFNLNVCFYCIVDHFLKCFFSFFPFLSLYCLNPSCFKVCFMYILKYKLSHTEKFCSDLKLFLIITVFILAVKSIYLQHFLHICISDKLVKFHFKHLRKVMYYFVKKVVNSWIFKFSCHIIYLTHLNFIFLSCYSHYGWQYR